MVVDYSLLGSRLAAARKKRGLTQEKLAEMTELANNYISNIENNRSIPSLETVVKLCNALDITPNDILLGLSKEKDDYMSDELYELISKCSAKEKRLIKGFVELLNTEK